MNPILNTIMYTELPLDGRHVVTSASPGLEHDSAASSLLPPSVTWCRSGWAAGATQCLLAPFSLATGRSARAWPESQRNMTSLVFNPDEYSDLVLVPQDDGPRPIAPITYSSNYVELMDIFRGLLLAEEISARGLALTTELIDYNAANYTVWHYRRQCLKTLNPTDEPEGLNQELQWVSQVGGSNPKNYQIWFHRRALVDILGTAEAGDNELAFTASVFEEDAKNYHAWGHRQWVLERFNLMAAELSFVNKCLTTDVRNNSAWNQRWFYYAHTEPAGAPFRPETLRQEIAFCFQKLDVVLKNQAAWAYLEGLLEGQSYADFPEVEAYVRAKIAASLGVPPVLSVLVDILEQQAAADAETAQERREEATRLCVQLAQDDPIRAKYWAFRKAELTGRSEE